MPKSTFHRDALLNHYRGTQLPAPPAQWWFALHTSDPGPSCANEVNPVSHPWYARAPINASAAAWEAPSDEGANRKIRNDAAITFASPTTSVTVTHFSFWDAQTNGNCWRYGQLTNSRSLQNGDNAPTFAADAYTLQEG